MYLGRPGTGNAVGITLSRETRLVIARMRPYAYKLGTGVTEENHSFTAKGPHSYRVGGDRTPYWPG